MTTSRSTRIRIPDDPSVTQEEHGVGSSSSSAAAIPDLVIVKDGNDHRRRRDSSGGDDEEESRSTQSGSSSDDDETTTKLQHRKRTFVIVVLLALFAIVLASVAIVVGIITHNNNNSNSNNNPQQQGQLSSSSTVGSVEEDGGVSQSSSNLDTTSMPDDMLPVSSSSLPIPTTAPTDMPISSPTSSPSTIPSDLPSDAPSETPTFRPTPDPVPVNPVPLNPPPGYFNYDDNTPYGPKNWHLVDTSNTWLREFGKDGWGAWKGIRRNNKNNKDEDLTQNLCGANVRKQSPKDMVEIVNCSATHEIRTKCAVDPLWDNEAFSKVILPHKLSIVPAGRECLKVLENGWGVDECRIHQPPIVDYPVYSSDGSDYSDMHHFDIKVPGEHTLEGEVFDAEIQIFHVHLDDGRFSSIGIPIRATNNGTFNQEFQFILDEFQTVYDIDAEVCRNTTAELASNLRGTAAPSSGVDNETTTWISGSDIDDRFADDDQGNRRRRELTFIDKVHKYKFNPYSDAFMTTMFFYRYDGSITEPPCKDITWWVMKDPMYIDFDQLDQLRTILFTHVDQNCQKTSVHTNDSEGRPSVTRPIQERGDRIIEYCKDGDFRSDVDKGRPPAKQCRWSVE
mmetsp:Transcript_38112/g.92700  ORF Transcript_38112/g.92700 Transcript_38112/m.92700 type:complete len:620 (+) Transcript_38112:1-1860(+)